MSHGHPITSGIPSSVVDYYISWAAAELELEVADQHYSEKLVLLPRESIHQYYVRISTDEVRKVNVCAII